MGLPQNDVFFQTLSGEAPGAKQGHLSASAKRLPKEKWFIKTDGDEVAQNS